MAKQPTRKQPMKNLTLRPFEYKGSTEYPDGLYNGHDLRLADMDTIWAVGRTPREAIRALCKARLGSFGGVLTPLPVRPFGGPPLPVDGYTWGYRFTADGTGCKAAGIHVPGGVICTWWK